MTTYSREILKIKDFDPMNVDVTFLEDVSSQIPSEGAISGPMAEQLATACLYAADKCCDLLAQATLYLSHCDGIKREAKAIAISECLSRKVPSTIVREVCASDEKLIKVSNQYDIALAWHTWLEAKRDTLVKTHHLCKDLIRKFDQSQSVENPGWVKTMIKEDSSYTKKYGEVDFG